MKLNLFNTVNNEECRRGQWFGSSVDSLACTPLCAQYNVFLAATLFVQPQDHSFTPPPPPPPQGLQILLISGVTVLLLLKFWSQFWRKIRHIWSICEPCPPFIFPLINQCDGCLVPLAWGFMAGGRGFASHRDVRLSRGWLHQTWKPPDILGTHLHKTSK